MGWPITDRKLLAGLLVMPSVLLLLVWVSPVTDWLWPPPKEGKSATVSPGVTTMIASLVCAALSTVAAIVAVVKRLPRPVVVVTFVPPALAVAAWVFSGLAP